jgi:acyl-CoA synthetase (AMP-forming)/AMP-acid ligase II
VITIDGTTTIGDAFARSAEAYGSRPFLAAPAGAHRNYHRNGYQIDFATAAREVQRLCLIYGAHGFGHGHRAAMLLDNRPEHFLHKLALNTLGVSCVPVNPDYRAGEIAYLLENSEVDLAIVCGDRREQLLAGMETSSHKAPIVLFEELASLSAPARARRNDHVSAASEASVLYTSGTTGRPRAACCRTATSSNPGHGTRRAVISHRCANRASEFITPCPCITSTLPFCRSIALCLAGAAKSRPTGFIRADGGRKSARHGPQSFTISG